MMKTAYHIACAPDSSGTWRVTDTDIPGLSCEAESLEDLEQRIVQLVIVLIGEPGALAIKHIEVTGRGTGRLEVRVERKDERPSKREPTFTAENMAAAMANVARDFAWPATMPELAAELRDTYTDEQLRELVDLLTETPGQAH